MKNKKILSVALIGTFSGFINGLLGAGGGMIVAPILTKFMNIDRNTAHANAVFIIFILCVASSLLYVSSDVFNYREVIPYLPSGIVGSIFGAYLLPKINKKILRISFGIFSIWSASRLLFK